MLDFAPAVALYALMTLAAYALAPLLLLALALVLGTAGILTTRSEERR